MLVWLALTTVATIGAYGWTRGFVRRRLRFVDAVRRPAAPAVAGLASALVAVPLAAALPVLTVASGVWVAAAVGVGVARGRQVLALPNP